MQRYCRGNALFASKTRPCKCLHASSERRALLLSRHCHQDTASDSRTQRVRTRTNTPLPLAQKVSPWLSKRD
ncbi:hypothetical protein BCR34DRAFT_573748 [Clohesyomyces aquaticus]|uniref:Uncharacterized protein n=1 Tax=Clohesyomyces aquaticus TaxID=1231657 RepID=A0A1Y1YYJ7_9PLEO|nr:hypothetical protein BCR34DRAFT_573748 [Clohesyomyces aquaticus]